ncbi:coatomer WD associated region-domain-containing protein [Boletus edulis]|nr:coatomer WD associated region-domain-containing protein [Boletus edulis]
MGSDDMTIKAWDWDKQWKRIQGHTHYIMNIAFNPKDANTFVSPCLDRSVKMWSLRSGTANSTMDAHDKGVNYVDFYPGPDRPYLVTTGDDKTIKVWDHLSKSCVQTMEGHTVFHPNLPIIINGSEDGTVRIWNDNTYRLENTLSYALEMSWCVALRRDANEVAIGFDEGIVVIKLGRDEPTFSMDPAGKLIYTRNQLVLSGNVQSLTEDTTAEGNRIPLPIKELGTTEIFATNLFHSPNGRFVTVVGDGEYIIYTALAWRNESFGNGLSFAWAGDSNTYAVLESKLKLRVYKNFKERGGAGVKGSGSWSIDGLHGGPLLGAQGKGFVAFWDWESGEMMDVDAKNIYWSGTGSLVAITSQDSFYVVSEVSDNVMTAKWVGDCFIYTTTGNRINYFVGNESYTIGPSDTPMYILGYIPAHNRVYLADKDMHIYTYALSLSVVEYQTAVLRGDMEGAAEILPTPPKEQLNKVARFLERRDLKEIVIQVTSDPDHKFDLSLQLDDLDAAVDIIMRNSKNAIPDLAEDVQQLNLHAACWGSHISVEIRSEWCEIHLFECVSVDLTAPRGGDLRKDSDEGWIHETGETLCYVRGDDLHRISDGSKRPPFDARHAPCLGVQPDADGHLRCATARHEDWVEVHVACDGEGVGEGVGEVPVDLVEDVF